MKATGNTTLDFLSIQLATSCGVIVVQTGGVGGPEALSGTGIVVTLSSLLIRSSWLWVVITGTLTFVGKL